jgi:protein-L-isoaspartate(D-aspartate) O-methyltransferase
MAPNWLERGPAVQRVNMVNGQLKTSEVTDPALLAAFLEVPRERFVAPALSKLAYLDQDQPAAAGARRLLAPRTLARLLQAAAITPGERALDVGGGTGYSAALLVRLGAAVVALESDRRAAAFAREALAGQNGFEVLEGDLAAGAPARAPFDVILVNGAFSTTPSELLDQLDTGGRLVGVDSRAGASHGVLIEKQPVGFSERSLFDAKADVLDGFRPAAGFVF